MAERLTLELMHELAAVKGGKCLSTKYHDSRTHLLWECDQGHRFEASPMHIREGSWCRSCASRLKAIKLNELMKKRRDEAKDSRG